MPTLHEKNDFVKRHIHGTRGNAMNESYIFEKFVMLYFPVFISQKII